MQPLSVINADTWSSIGVVLLLLGILGPDPVAAQHNSPDPERRLSQLVHEVWTEDHGIPQASIEAIGQTHDGYLWFGTQQGLVRYNGRVFKVFDAGNTPALDQGQKIRDMLVDHLGRLWIGLHSGLILYEDGEFKDASESLGVEKDAVSDIYQDSGLTVWVGQAKNGVFITDGTSIRMIGDHLASDSNPISSVLPNEDGSYWVGTRKGLILVRKKQNTKFTTEDGLSSNNISALFRDNLGRVWIGTDQGIHIVQRETIYGSPDPALSDVYAHVFMQDDRGSIWIGTDTRGIARVNGAYVEFFDQNLGLTRNSVKSIYEDLEGSIWIGTDGGGINRLRQDKFRTYSTTEGLPSNIVYTVIEDANGGIWFGTENNGVARLTGNNIEVFDKSDGLSGNDIGGLATTPDGSVWIGTFGYGLNRFKDGQFTHYGAPEGLTDPYAAALYADSGGRLWIGTNSGIFMRGLDGTFKKWSKEDGLESNYITTIGEDNDGTIWVGTWDAGVHRLEGEQFIHVDANEKMRSQQIMAFHVDASNTIWIATYGGGITRIRNDRTRTYAMAEGLHSDDVYTILEADDGTLWMTSDNGIFTIPKLEFDLLDDGKTEKVSATVYTKEDGLKSKEMNGGLQPAGWRARDGRMWFPSIKGVAMIDPLEIRTNDRLPPIVIEEFEVNDTRLDPQENHTLKPGIEKIEIKFAALSYESPDQIRYRYRLVGNDDSWTESSLGTATYTNLPNGEYTFRLVASNNDGLWNLDGKTLSFVVEPHIWETSWFIILCVFSGLLLVGGVFKIRTLQMEARQREIECERDRAQKADQFKSVILDNLNHEFRTPLTGILGYADLLEQELANEQREFIGYIISNGQRLLSTLDSLLELAHVQNNTLNLEIKEQQVSNIAESVADRHRKAAQQKLVSVDVDLPSDLPDIPLDETAFEYALSAIVDNGIKFTDSGSIRITAEATDNQLEIRVSDSGVGIDMAEADRIFEPFRQLSEGLSRSHEGAGVGLTISRHLVTTMGGELILEDSSPAGSTFLMRFQILPVAPPPSGTTGGFRLRKAEDRSSRTLRHDDDSSHRDGIESDSVRSANTTFEDASTS